MNNQGRDGGYDAGYRECPCFWGDQPGSLVARTFSESGTVMSRVLDLGCGEGKNAAYLARRGATVDAVECSEHALQNASAMWGQLQGVTWHMRDAVEFVNEPHDHYDVVIMYGLLHCLASRDDALSLIRRCREITKVGGLHLVCAFNDRHQDLSAHPGFHPLLLSHTDYVDAYRGWRVDASDDDLHEVHPHNGIPHTHSMTRLTAVASR